MLIATRGSSRAFFPLDELSIFWYLVFCGVREVAYVLDVLLPVVSVEGGSDVMERLEDVLVFVLYLLDHLLLSD